MSTADNPLRRFAAELRRRHVFKVGALYAAVAWALIEAANTILPRLGVPDWSVTLVIALALFGFPLALVLAWSYDLTPQGVRRTDDTPATELQATTPAAGTASPVAAAGGRSALLALTIAILLATGLFVRAMRGDDAAAARAAAEIRSIAVLPFQNAGAGEADEYLSEGIAEELLHRLARVPELRVAARTSSFAFRGAQLDVREIGTRLNVDVVLEGSVRSTGERLRVAARLVSTRDGYQLWSEVYEREAADIFRMQDEISAAIVERLRPAQEGRGEVAETHARIASSGVSAPLSPEPESYEAFELYLRGRFEWNRRTEDGLRAAARYFEQAIARSPGFARAHHGLADASAVLGFYDYVAPLQAFPHARQAAARALELDPALVEAHATLAYVLLYHDWDFAAAEREFRRALELNPRYAVAHQWYGNLLTAMGRFDEAVREMRTAQALDPLALIAPAAQGWVHIQGRGYDRAITQLGSVLQRDSTYFLANLWLGQALELSGRAGEAADVLRRALRIAPHSVLAEASLARALAAAGRDDEARRIVAGLEARSAREYVTSYEIALAHIALGDHASALDRLERAAEERAHAIAFLGVDPRLDPLRGSDRFERLLRRTRGG